MEQERVYQVHFRREPEGGFTATVPSVPGCVTWGETLQEAIENAKEALVCHLGALEEAGDPIPPSDPVQERIEIPVAAAV